MLALDLLLGLAWIFGAVRLAKPDSWWARRFYSEEKSERARRELPRRVRMARVAGAAAIVVVTPVFVLMKTYRVPTSAMEPTLRCARPHTGCSATYSDHVAAVRFIASCA